jgi:hypothetical protein
MNLHADMTEAFRNLIANGDEAELRDMYCDMHKDAYGVKGRFVYSKDYTREEWLSMFNCLLFAIDESIEADRLADEAFMHRIDGLGLKEWAERNGIKSELDLTEYNYRHYGI